MNLSEAIKKLKSENELCLENREGECGGYNYKDGKCYCAGSIIVRALEEYIKIGTVEECRKAREKQNGKKPEHFHKKYGKHKWRRTESGEIDECAWDFRNHNGVACEICGETVCVLCNPNYDELYDCEEEYWICPNCAKKIYCKDEYCQCGQHLDWSDAP